MPSPAAVRRKRCGRTASVAGPVATPFACTGQADIARLELRARRAAHQLAAHEIGVADEVGEEAAARRFVQLDRRALLRDRARDP
jgi:hypothetical protein